MMFEKIPILYILNIAVATELNYKSNGVPSVNDGIVNITVVTERHDDSEFEDNTRYIEANRHFNGVHTSELDIEDWEDEKKTRFDTVKRQAKNETRAFNILKDFAYHAPFSEDIIDPIHKSEVERKTIPRDGLYLIEFIRNKLTAL